MQVIKTDNGNFHGNLTRGSSFKLIIRLALVWPHLIGVMQAQSLHPLNPLTCPPTPRLRRTLQNVLYAPSIVFFGKGSKIFCDSCMISFRKWVLLNCSQHSKIIILLLLEIFPFLAEPTGKSKANGGNRLDTRTMRILRSTHATFLWSCILLTECFCKFTNQFSSCWATAVLWALLAVFDFLIFWTPLCLLHWLIISPR